MTILTYEDGRPIARPEPLPPGAGIEAIIAHQRATAAYNDEVSGVANRAFASEFRKAMRR